MGQHLQIRPFLLGVGIVGFLGAAWVFSGNSFAAATRTGAAATAVAAPATKADTKPATKPETKPATTASAPATASAASTCIRCHPFDKVIAASASYVTKSGEKGNPHVYIGVDTTNPHESKAEKNAPDCLKCHTTHSLAPLPAKGSIDLKALDVKWCYDACHHEKNFVPCKKCH